MVMAAHLSQRLGLIDGSFVRRLTRLIEAAGLPIKGPILPQPDPPIGAASNADRYLALMRGDKKATAGEIKFVLIDRPGSAAVRVAPDGLVRQVIDSCCE